ncbi:MAG: DUF881 domain-containing protein [Peptostreptococcaceae bacterium]
MKIAKTTKYKIRIIRWGYILVAFLLGIFIAIYLKSINSNNTYITLEQKRELEDEISKTKLNIEKLKKIELEYEKKLESYKDVFEDENKSLQELMQKEIESLKEISGYEQLIGSGVKITIKDSERALSKGENPNDLIVHDIDILRILNDLKKSGAKGISINGERVLPNSQIKCSGATITVNKTTYGQPFIIEAIGDKKSLVASINSPESYANLLRDVYGIYINIEEVNEMVLNFHEKSK